MQASIITPTQERNWLTAGAIALLVLATLWIAVLSGVTTAMDDAVLPVFYPTSSSGGVVASMLAVVGDTAFVGACAGIAAVALVLRRRVWTAARVLGVVGVVAIAVAIIKQVVHRARPLAGSGIEVGYSFPSGHASTSAAIACLAVWLVLRRRGPSRETALLLALGGGWALVIALDRLVLGVHYLSDVLAGWALGTAAACFTLVVLARAEARWPDALKRQSVR